MTLSVFLTIVRAVPLLLWQLLFLAGLVLVLCGSWMHKKILQRWVMGAGCCGVLIATFFLACYAHSQRCCLATMVQPVSVRVGPAQWYHEIGTVQPGELIRVCQRDGAWCCVQAEMCRGWIS